MGIVVKNIEWETDGEEVDLPTEVVIKDGSQFADPGSEVADWLSDQYGWLVRSHTIETTSDLADVRRLAADAQFDGYDFGGEVEDATGWEYTTPGREWTRAVYLASDKPEGDTVKASFTVVFEGDESSEVAEAYCMLNGNLIGRAAPAQSPLAP